ncbi:hypothetical protein ZIOFF_018437 [Zingiber officinale]|uniref:Uncharacterized protein n=1 Tax=Zingiber officinale TaxID=94328 RepID=A0A8J5LAX7_ZINOF|nr:hypothetical protein ZIOFF_018437 [Zingiber officinale]
MKAVCIVLTEWADRPSSMSGDSGSERLTKQHDREAERGQPSKVVVQSERQRDDHASRHAKQQAGRVDREAGRVSWCRSGGRIEPVMQLDTEATDGSYIEFKDTDLVWHHQYADPDFIACQTKELLDHLENVLANEPMVVKRCQHIVEVKPQGISKGVVAGNLL